MLTAGILFLVKYVDVYKLYISPTSYFICKTATPNNLPKHVEVFQQKQKELLFFIDEHEGEARQGLKGAPLGEKQVVSQPGRRISPFPPEIKC